MNPKKILHNTTYSGQLYHSNEYSLPSRLKPDYHSFLKHSYEKIKIKKFKIILKKINVQDLV